MLAFRGETYTTALETPYAPGAPGHADLEDLDSRSAIEAGLLDGLKGMGISAGPFEIVVDLPEPVTFESDLPVVDSSGGAGGTVVPFRAGPTVFRPPVVEAFVRTLRVVRIFLPPRVLDAGGDRLRGFLREALAPGGGASAEE